MLTLTVFPLINLLIPEGRVKYLRAQYVIHRCFAFFISQMVVLGIMTVEVTGIEKLKTDRAKLILANHPTLIDVVLLISLVENSNCIVKQALWKNPFLRGVVRAAGYISNRESESFIDDCAAALKNGDNLIIFPEGTRSVPGRPMRMQRGAAHIAAKSGVNIIPVTITCHPSTLTKSEKWYQIPPRRFHLKAEIGDEIEVAEIVAKDMPAAISSRRITNYLKNYFTERLERFETVRARA